MTLSGTGAPRYLVAWDGEAATSYRTWDEITGVL